MRRKMSLTNALAVTNGDVVALTGTGGKTSCLYKLGEEQRKSSVLLTTTTKMKYPSKDQVDFIYSEEELEGRKGLYKPGRTFLYGELQAQNKCSAVSEEKLKEIISGFDVTIIEADGSRMLPLKGYLDNEPCIPDFVSLNIGMITTLGLGRPADPSFILRWSEFQEMTGLKSGELIHEKHLANWISHPMGMFKGSPKRKVLYFNQVERFQQIRQIQNVIQHLDKHFLKELTRITAGSVKNEEYKVLWTKEENGE